MNNIQYSFDKKIKGYVINMPEYISLKSIEEWKNEMNHELKSLPSNQNITMLIDTNKHEFESVQCLRSLRDFFTSNTNLSNIVKVAFVQPKNYMSPHVKSEQEAYFENIKEAYIWLKN